MQAYEIDEVHWVLKLASQLTGKAQQSYAAMDTAQAAEYNTVKAAMLRHYKINAETYHMIRFRSAKCKDSEMHIPRW